MTNAPSMDLSIKPNRMMIAELLLLLGTDWGDQPVWCVPQQIHFIGGD